MEHSTKSKTQLIRELKALQEKVKEIDYFKTALKNSPVVVFNQDRELRYTWIYNPNPGFDPNSILGKSDAELLPGKDAATLIKIKNNVMESKKEARKIVRTTIQGKAFYYDLTVVPLYDDNGEITGVTCATTDITEHRKTEKQLRQSQKMESLGTLSGGIAHEFNNMLVPILGHAEMLARKFPKHVIEQNHLREIMNAGDRAADLVRQIMTFSRSTDADFEPVDMKDAVKQALDLVKSMIPANIELHEHLQGNCNPVLADNVQIHQIILNLCSNAQHAMEDSGKLEIHLEQLTELPPELELEGEAYVKLSVKDTGHGIAPSEQERIFDPFYTTKEVGIGTGLGLSIVHGIVNQHQGAITVKSKIGQGTTISIFFPTTQNSTIAKTPDISIAKDSVRGGNILVVEDEPSIVALYREYFLDSGYNATICSDGKEAFDLFRRSASKYDVVFTDHQMPSMTGKQLCEKLLKIKPDIPIILSTGYSNSVSKEEADELGIRHFIEKPVKLEKLDQLIQGCLQNPKSDEQSS